MQQPSVFRRLWQPPGLLADRPTDRRVGFIELFFDLVFVVVIAQIAHHLAAHPSWEAVGWFVFLFYAIWSSWLNGTLYHDLHPTNDVSVRVFTFAQMLAVAVMAVYVGDVPGEGADGFAAAYAANSLILVVLWFRTGVHDPNHRPASVPYSAAYLISAACFLASVGLDEPAKYWVWGAGLLAEMAGAALSSGRRVDHQPGVPRLVITASLIERFGLFVIIVLGEVIVGAVTGMAEAREHGSNAITVGLIGVLVAIGLWWIYFDIISHRPPRQDLSAAWLLLHLPVVMAIAAGGAGVLNAVEHAGQPLPGEVRWLLAGALAVAMASVLLLSLLLEIREELPEVYRWADVGLLIGVLGAIGVGLAGWSAKATLGALAAMLMLPVFMGLTVWLKTQPADVDGGP